MLSVTAACSSCFTGGLTSASVIFSDCPSASPVGVVPASCYITVIIIIIVGVSGAIVVKQRSCIDDNFHE